MKTISCVVVIAMLTTQGCTVSIAPYDSKVYVPTNTPSVSVSGHKKNKGTAGAEGIRGPEGRAGDTGLSGEMMARKGETGAVPEAAYPHPYAAQAAPEPEPFSAKFWANVFADVVKDVTPFVVKKALD